MGFTTLPGADLCMVLLSFTEFDIADLFISSTLYYLHYSFFKNWSSHHLSAYFFIIFNTFSISTYHVPDLGDV